MTRWVADPGIGWRIVLTARLPHPPHADDVSARLAALALAQDWPAPPPIRVDADAAALRRALVHHDPAPLLAGVTRHDLVLSAHHGAADGLGLLQALAACGAGPVTSAARGIADRPSGAGPARTVARRLADPDVAAWPNLVHTLHYPKHHEAWFDIITNELDGPWYEERNPINLAHNIDGPVWLQIDQGRGLNAEAESRRQ